jgi:hypothetical protein
MDALPVLDVEKLKALIRDRGTVVCAVSNDDGGSASVVQFAESFWAIGNKGELGGPYEMVKINGEQLVLDEDEQILSLTPWRWIG